MAISIFTTRSRSSARNRLGVLRGYVSGNCGTVNITPVSPAGLVGNVIRTGGGNVCMVGVSRGVSVSALGGTNKDIVTFTAASGRGINRGNTGCVVRRLGSNNRITVVRNGTNGTSNRCEGGNTAATFATGDTFGLITSRPTS